MRARTWLGLAAGTLALSWGHAASAHFPMLLSEAALIEAGQEVSVEYSVGHPFANDRFDVAPPRHVRLFPPRGRPQELGDAVVQGGTSTVRNYRVTARLEKEGDYIFSFGCGLFREPPARQVEDYAKVVVHVAGAQVGWDRVVGDPIEVVPLTRPYGIPVGATFRGLVLENGQGRPGSYVEVETFPDGRERVGEFPELMTYRREEVTGPDGSFGVTFDRPGWWMLSTATDGGPGMQGGTPHPVKRAVFWVFVGPWDETARRALAPVVPVERREALPLLPLGGPGVGGLLRGGDLLGAGAVLALLGCSLFLRRETRRLRLARAAA